MAAHSFAGAPSLFTAFREDDSPLTLQLVFLLDAGPGLVRAAVGAGQRLPFPEMLPALGSEAAARPVSGCEAEQPQSLVRLLPTPSCPAWVGLGGRS